MTAASIFRASLRAGATIETRGPPPDGAKPLRDRSCRKPRAKSTAAPASISVVRMARTSSAVSTRRAYNSVMSYPGLRDAREPRVVTNDDRGQTVGDDADERDV